MFTPGQILQVLTDRPVGASLQAGDLVTVVRLFSEARDSYLVRKIDEDEAERFAFDGLGLGGWAVRSTDLRIVPADEIGDEPAPSTGFAPGDVAIVKEDQPCDAELFSGDRVRIVSEVGFIPRAYFVRLVDEDEADAARFSMTGAYPGWAVHETQIARP